MKPPGSKIAPQTRRLALLNDSIELLPNRKLYPEFVFWRDKLSGVAPDREVVARLTSADIPFERALVLLDGPSTDRALAFSILRDLGAAAVIERETQRPRPTAMRGRERRIGENLLGLTRRKMQVLALIAGSRSNKAIARELATSAKTVDLRCAGEARYRLAPRSGE